MPKTDLADIYKIFHPKEADYRLFSTAHRTFSITDHILGHETNLNSLRRLKSYKAKKKKSYKAFL